MNKLFSILASTFILVNTAYAATPSIWSEAYIHRAEEIGITAFHQFDKEYTEPLTREELCSLIVNTVEANPKTTVHTVENPFTDTDSADVLKAYELGIVNGMGENLFMPERKVTRQEAAKIFSTTLSLIADNTDGYSKDILSSFNDAQSISGWAEDYAAHLTSLGILKGDENDNFNPLGNITTEQGIALCVRVFDTANQTPPPPETDMKLEYTVNDKTAHISWYGNDDYRVTVEMKRNSYYPEDFDADIISYMTSSNTFSFDILPDKIYTVKITNSRGEIDKIEFKTDKFNIDSDHREEVKALTDTFDSDEAASASMVTFEVNVWQLGKSGDKIAATLPITVNTLLADRYKAVFDEIFAGDEKFPIYSLGAYAWRAPMASGRYSEHNLGTAIDINSDHNYCLYSDGSTVGECYSPYDCPYSITPYGDVVNAFEKYGFTWGGDAWKNPKDYMHFSYLGT